MESEKKEGGHGGDTPPKKEGGDASPQVIFEGYTGDDRLKEAKQFIQDAKFIAMVPRNAQCRKEYINFRLEDDNVTITEEQAIAECNELLKTLITAASMKIPSMKTADRLKAKLLKKQFFRELRVILGDDAETFLGVERKKTT